MMRKVLLIALALAALCCAAGAQTRETPAWQSTEAASVRLGVRDKFAALGSYEATFVVSTPDGLKLLKSVTVTGDDWGEVVFPDDFNTPGRYIGGARPGSYRWECIVRGEVVERGGFSVVLTNDRGPSKPQLNRPRKRRGAKP